MLACHYDKIQLARFCVVASHTVAKAPTPILCKRKMRADGFLATRSVGGGSKFMPPTNDGERGEELF